MSDTWIHSLAGSSLPDISGGSSCVSLRLACGDCAVVMKHPFLLLFLLGELIKIKRARGELVAGTGLGSNVHRSACCPPSFLPSLPFPPSLPPSLLPPPTLPAVPLVRPGTISPGAGGSEEVRAALGAV